MISPLCGGEPGNGNNSELSPREWGRWEAVMPRDLHELSRLEDSLSYLYIDKAIVARDVNSIVIMRGMREYLFRYLH